MSPSVCTFVCVFDYTLTLKSHQICRTDYYYFIIVIGIKRIQHLKKIEFQSSG